MIGMESSRIKTSKVNEVVGKFECRPREFEGIWYKIVSVIAISMSLFHLYTAGFGVWEAIRQRAVHLTFALVLVFLLYPATPRSDKSKPSPVDMLLALAAIGSIGYMALFSDEVAMRGFFLLPQDYIAGIIGTILVFEACRRAVGKELALVGLVFLAYTFFGQYLPGTFGHTGFGWRRIISHMYLTTEGLFGMALGVSATFIILFIIFGAFLNASGLGRLFNDLAFGLTGHMAGGPAKVAVVSSGLMGMISGSAIANVTTTGAFTIPLMRKVGYSSTFAAAVEAVASTGGQIMPPIMGATAFVMAELLGVSYLTIATSAIIPALLYYLGVLTIVHLRANRLGLLGLPKEDLPDPREVLKERGHLFIPIIGLVYFLAAGLSPTYAAFRAILLILIVSTLKANTRMSLPQIIDALRTGALQGICVAAACGLIGYIIGTTSLTALGVVLARNIVSLSRGFLPLTLLLTLAAAIILGMGLPTTAVYIVGSAICTPALRQMGVGAIPAAFFVFFYGILSTITPPVAMTAYAAAGLADANPNQVGWMTFKMALSGFIVPFVFVYQPAMLLIDTTFVEAFRVAITAGMGVIALGCALENYMTTPLRNYERVLLFGGALMMIGPGLITDVIGLALLIVGYLSQRRRERAS